MSPPPPPLMPARPGGKVKSKHTMRSKSAGSGKGGWGV